MPDGLLAGAAAGLAAGSLYAWSLRRLTMRMCAMRRPSVTVAGLVGLRTGVVLLAILALRCWGAAGGAAGAAGYWIALMAAAGRAVAERGR